MLPFVYVLCQDLIRAVVWTVGITGVTSRASHALSQLCAAAACALEAAPAMERAKDFSALSAHHNGLHIPLTSAVKILMKELHHLYIAITDFFLLFCNAC